MPYVEPIRAVRTSERPDEFFHGIPNRDLTEAEYQALDPDQRTLVRDSGLWDVKTQAQIKPAVERAEKIIEKVTAAITREGGN